MAGSPIGLQQLMRTQGIEWGDSGRGGGDFHLWFEGGTIYTDAVWSMLGGTNSVAANGSGSGVAGLGFAYTTGAGGGGNANGGNVTFTMGAPTGTGRSGVFTVTPASGVGASTGQIALGQLTNTTTIPDDTTSVNFVRVMAQFTGTTNAPSGNSGRGLYLESHYLDNTNSLATLAGGYFQAFHDGAGTTIADHFGLIGRTYITSTGIATNMWGIRGDLNFSGAGTATTATGVWSRFPTQFAGSTIGTWNGVLVDQVNFSTSTVTDAYAANFGVPANSSGYKIGVNIGTPQTSGNYTVGLVVNTAGAWFRGNATLPVHADTATTQCIIALMAGSNAGVNDTNNLIYFYRSSTSQGYIGFTSDQAVVVAGHTKVSGDLALISDSKLLIDAGGDIWSAGQLTATTSLKTVPTALVTGTLPTALSVNTAAHGSGAGLSNTATQEVFISLGFTKTFAGSTTIASMYGMNITRPTYAAVAALTITEVATLRVQNAPTFGANTTLTNTWALLVAAGSSFFGGAIVQGHATAAINSTNTATAAQAATGYITSTSAAPTTITLPTGTALGAALAAVQGTIHDLYIDNTAGASTVTVAVNTNAILSADAAANAASAGLLTVPSGVTGQACFRLMFSSATAYTFTRIA